MEVVLLRGHGGKKGCGLVVLGQNGKEGIAVWRNVVIQLRSHHGVGSLARGTSVGVQGGIIRFYSPHFEVHDETLLRCHMTRIGARMGEFLSAVSAFEGFLSAVYSEVLLEMMLELESFIAIVALELTEPCALVVTNHVPLQPIHIREALVADLACLLTKEKAG